MIVDYLKNRMGGTCSIAWDKCIYLILAESPTRRYNFEDRQRRDDNSSMGFRKRSMKENLNEVSQDKFQSLVAWNTRINCCKFRIMEFFDQLNNTCSRKMLFYTVNEKNKLTASLNICRLKWVFTCYEIWGSHGNVFEEYHFLECNTV